MYPRNAASPERIAIGPVILIADGTPQSSGVTVTVRGQGGAEAGSSGTIAYGATGVIVYYTPTQAETDFTSFTVIASKAACIPVCVTIVTTASATPGYAGVDWGKVTNATSTVNLSGTTVATVTNQLTAAAIATGVWQDATAGDFTTASSIGKALYIANVAPGGSGGHMISGSNAGTTTLGALTVTGATTLTGAVSLGSTLGVTGATTLGGLTTGALAATTITASGAVAFQSTFTVTTSSAFGAISGSTLTLSGAVALQSTLAVTGTTTLTGAVSAINGANDIRGVLLSGTQTFNLTGNITGNLSGSVGSVTGLTASDVGAIKVQTDKLVFTAPGYLDVNVLRQNGATMYGTGTAVDLWRGTP